MKNIYLLYGENKESIIDFSKKVAQEYLKNDLDEYTFVKLNMKETTIQDLVYECNTGGLFLSKKVVVAESSVFLQAKTMKIKVEHNVEVLEKYISNPSPSTILILTCYENIDSRKKIVKKIKEVSIVKEFNNFSPKDIFLYVKNYFKDKNIAIENEVINFFIEYSSEDFLNVVNELDKLYLYVEDKGYIDKEDIELLVTKSLEYDVFLLTNNLFSKNYNKLFEIYRALILRGEEPIFLLSLIASQLRLYYRVKILLNENYTQKDIAKRISEHPYRVQLAIKDVYNYSLEKIFNCIILCKNCDKDLKTKTYTEKNIILELFINRLINELN